MIFVYGSTKNARDEGALKGPFRVNRIAPNQFSVRCCSNGYQGMPASVDWRYVTVTMEDSDPPRSIDTAMYNVLTMCEMGVLP